MDTISLSTEKKNDHSVLDVNKDHYWTKTVILKMAGFLAIFLLLGVATGFVIAALQTSPAKLQSVGKSVKKEVASIKNKKIFKDSAEGILREGGIDGEGSFHLERPGGESQNVYLTSSVVDLSEYVGKKVKVWGETFEAEKAGWLMDVGLVELL